MNNINLIIPLLKFESDDDFYFIQIIKRKKEHPELGSNNKVIKTYYLKSADMLESIIAEIEMLCNFHNARAYINLNKRSFEKLAYQMLKKVTDLILNKEFKHIKNAYNSVCGENSNAKEDKTWIIDFDTKDESFIPALINVLKDLEPIGDKVIAKIPTKNGFHLIAKPFNRQSFGFLFGSWCTIPKPDIHTNNPTLLYFNQSI